MAKTRYVIQGRRANSDEWVTLYSPNNDIGVEIANTRFDALNRQRELLQIYCEFKLEVVKSEVIRKATCVLELREETRYAT